jgi:hypothetical protein
MKLSSNSGNNAKAVVWGSMAILVNVISQMPDDYERTALLSLFCICMTIINWRTEGSGISPAEGEQIKKGLSAATEEDIAKSLRRGRLD